MVEGTGGGGDVLMKAVVMLCRHGEGSGRGDVVGVLSVTVGRVVLTDCDGR